MFASRLKQGCDFDIGPSPMRSPGQPTDDSLRPTGEGRLYDVQDLWISTLDDEITSLWRPRYTEITVSRLLIQEAQLKTSPR